MPAKTPIYLKSTNSRKGKKCRLRDILSPDMISPPLGDFRHTIHIGKGGERDAFGDMSFLQGKYDLLPGTQEKRLPQCVAHNEFLRAHSTSEAPSFEASSPVLKNAISLPAIGGSQALTLPIISTTPFPPNSDPFDRTDPPAPSLLEKDSELERLEQDMLLLSLDVFSASFDPSKEAANQSGFWLDTVEVPGGGAKKKLSENGQVQPRQNGFKVTEPNHSNGNGTVHQATQLCAHRTPWLHGESAEEDQISTFKYELPKGDSASQDSLSKASGSLLSLELDLGPSILDEVLNVMDGTKTEIKL
ncbi:cdc42 effector protein 3-like [Scleropages formosus]|uniref:Cdc42 effector protein 3-like n=1 Tax=Scleropages formosus TaxID=113540 RepID=A0A0P7VQQ4_SCLFO|nr:cdc42 effector protein 3 [Scleropages formosus]XP_018593686.2 cdc42 effector protein 3 [Scleropages formosus]XP_018593688.2 cdc42 effector protein 3 [Scleropages formosus]XP_029110126.1 cdc42 effector protein 3 [Scleropages formosus]KPP75842.1 cdc42 effector protein 3-like [Scleropages formosus]